MSPGMLDDKSREEILAYLCSFQSSESSSKCGAPAWRARELGMCDPRWRESLCHALLAGLDGLLHPHATRKGDLNVPQNSQAITELIKV